MSAPGSGGTSGGEHGERGNGLLSFRNRQGPAAQAVSVKRMEPSAQAQLGALGLTGFIVVTVIATGIDAGVFPEKLGHSVLPPVLVVFVGMTVSGFTGSQTWLRVTGWSGLLAALGATYLLAGQIMASTWGRQVLPMGRFLAPEEHPEA
ncbi:hypothetical protein OG311_09665 [Streptomyces sp. NBC_01343]|uniref:hypothetical protein n=1 Tax=Streptomyces sp. NBC_01343 TaxID=2903832 RepID=UPI002E0ED543|nr:hypothetical protein OG311_09665 [Streptomyces sp. NBC_01343]